MLQPTVHNGKHVRVAALPTMRSVSKNDRSAELSTEFGGPIGVTHSIGSPIEDLWAAISSPGNLEICHPFCESNPVSIWPGPESRDEIHYLNGKVYQRRFIDWTDGVGYDLIIVESDQRIALVRWKVEAETPTTCRLSITVRPSALQGIPLPLQGFPYLLYVRPMLHRYLKSVVQGFDWYLTRGVPVLREQFGSHRWFST